MNGIFWSSVAALSLIGGLQAADAYRASGPERFLGLSDASASASLGNDIFVAASDEGSSLVLYRTAAPGGPIREITLADFLGTDRRWPQSDIEAAARIGDRVYWITSHARNREGKARPGRQRLFATTVKGTGLDVNLVPVGQPYSELLRDFASAPQLRRFKLADAAERAPEESGALNIEGLAATPDGRLLIGFRNPVPEGNALLVPLTNPAAVVGGARAELGDPLLLDLNGLGIRDMVLAGTNYYLIGGPSDGRGRSRLFTWAGGNSRPRQLKNIKFEDMNAEGLVWRPGGVRDELLVLSDDGNRLIDGVPNKELKDPSERSFRAVRVTRTGKGVPEGARP